MEKEFQEALQRHDARKWGKSYVDIHGDVRDPIIEHCEVVMLNARQICEAYKNNSVLVRAELTHGDSHEQK